MTDLERFNLFWLCHAMTAPVMSEETYYYDSAAKKFFTNKEQVLFDMVDLPIPDPVADDLKVKLAAIDSETSGLVEIPRLNMQDKVAVQLLFLSKFPGIVQEEKLRLAAEQQQDTYGFVLDKLDEFDEIFAPILPYWDDFKLKTIQYYLERFTGVIGITLKIL